MEIYILSKQDLSILSIAKLIDYEINLDEETNSKSTFKIIKTDGLAEGNFLVLNGLYKQFLFVIASDGVSSDKGSNVCTVTALDISNIFDRKIIEKDTDTMTTNSIEEFLANMMSENFVNSDDAYLNKEYIDIYYNTATNATVATNAENGLYNFHTFLTNCRQYKNICTEFKIENKRLIIDITNKEEDTVLVDTTLSEVVDYNKVYETDVTAKVEVYIREDGSTYNLYLKTDRTTTTNKDDVDRANGKIEVISVDTADKAEEEALNVIKGNSYNHLVEFKIAKSSKLMDISKLTIGRPILIKTDDDIYSSYISAITIKDENFVYFKSGNLRITLLDKIKKSSQSGGNKLDVSGGKIIGNLDIGGALQVDGKALLDLTYPVGAIYMSVVSTSPATLFGGTWERISRGRFLIGVKEDNNYQENNITEFGATTDMIGYLFTAENMGGEYKHKLTDEESGLREHTHALGLSQNAGVETYTDMPYRGKFAGGGGTVDDKFRTGRTTTLSDLPNDYGAEYIVNLGDVKNAIYTHNNMPPYFAVYMWKRTA